MSYILDALRKSEQERRNQDASASFSAGMMNTQANAVSQKSPWVWVAVAVVVSANVLALLLIFKDQIMGREEVIAPPELSTSQAVPSQVVTSKTETSQVSSADARSPEAEIPQSVHGSPASSYSHQGQSVDPDVLHRTNVSVPPRYQQSGSTRDVGQVSSQSARSSSIPAHQEDLGFDYSEADIIRPKTQRASANESDISDPYEAAVEDKSSSLMSQYQRVQEESRRPRYDVVNVSKSGSEGVDGTGSVRAQLLDGLEEPQVIKPNSKGVAQPVASVSYSQSEAESLPRIHDLTSLQKANIPAIRFSGHLYSSRSSSRSIRLDGVKYKEGDRITRELSLHSITEDGVVFDLDGSLFYMSSFDDWNGIN